MNKRILKKILIIMGLILLVTNFIICLTDLYLTDLEDIIWGIFNMGFKTLDNFWGLESILLILGMILLILGLILKSGNISTEAKNNTDLIRKYKILRILGYLPFVGILCLASYYSIYGFSFLWSTVYGFEAFLGSIITFSIGLWHLYIIGIILIIKSSLKIRSFKKSEVQNFKQNNKNINI